MGTTDAGEKEIKLHGQIVITAADVSKAVPGNYTGTATFDITYTKEEEPTLPGGSSLGGSTLPGGSSLGGSSLGGNSSLGGSSDLGGASTIKTGDEERGIVLWILLLAVSAGTVTAGAVCRKYKRNQH